MFFANFDHWILNIVLVKNKIFAYILLFLPLSINAQKITLGSCVTHDGGMYKGELMNGKPHGKGVTVFKNGDM